MSSSHRAVAILQLAFVAIFISITVLLFFPLQKQLSARMQDLKYNIHTLLEENVGTTISFSSIHPSIFSFGEIRDLKVYDTEGQPILTVDRLILRYRLGALLRGNVLGAPRQIRLRGGTFFIDRLITLVNAGPSGSGRSTGNNPF